MNINTQVKISEISLQVKQLSESSGISADVILKEIEQYLRMENIRKVLMTTSFVSEVK